MQKACDTMWMPSYDAHLELDSLSFAFESAMPRSFLTPDESIDDLRRCEAELRQALDKLDYDNALERVPFFPEWKKLIALQMTALGVWLFSASGVGVQSVSFFAWILCLIVGPLPWAIAIMSWQWEVRARAFSGAELRQEWRAVRQRRRELQESSRMARKKLEQKKRETQGGQISIHEDVTARGGLSTYE